MSRPPNPVRYEKKPMRSRERRARASDRAGERALRRGRLVARLAEDVAVQGHVRVRPEDEAVAGRLRHRERLAARVLLRHPGGIAARLLLHPRDADLERDPGLLEDRPPL